MPTPDPSLLPAAVTTVSGYFTTNYATVLAGVGALIAIVTIPVIVVRGGIGWAVGGIRRLFRRA
jgi:hypothetical protein